MRISKIFLTWAAMLGAAGVVAGALGAHLIQPGLSDVDAKSFDTAIFYLFVHVLALMLVVVMLNFKQPRWLLSIAGFSFAAAVPLFSGTIIARLALEWEFGMPLAPIGGSLFIVGWLALSLAAVLEPNND
ncbi:MAG: DUF423 domain-containing protein [Pseudomonadota bacterium]